jgi:hypothetical protein
MTSTNLSVRGVIRRFYVSFAKTQRLRADVQRAAHRILQCGTAAMGAHVRRCDCGHTRQIRYNSCRHRCCPSCSGGRRAAWLDQVARELLPCDHVHVVFTVPQSLNRFWQFNRVLFANVLMQAARESLLQLLADPKYLGAQPGILSALHTWGRNLSVHPHVHCLVTAGGIDKEGRFLRQQRKTLLPARVLMIVFRGRLRALLHSALVSGDLNLPSGMTRANTITLLNRLGRETWNVRIQERYPHGVSVAGYLARYIAGGPMSDRSLHSVTESRVAFRYRDYRDRQTKTMRLSPDDFLKRWFEHVPPRGLRTIRRSGLYANCHADLRQQIRGQAVTDSKSQPPPQVTLDFDRCELCNGIIRVVEISRPRYTSIRTPIRRNVALQGQPP